MKRFRSHPPDLRHVKTFIAVVQQGGFSKAAQVLFMTQPGVTTHINKLETNLGCILVERTAKQIIITSAGHKFYEFSLSMMSQLENVLDTIHADSDSVGGWLRVGAASNFSGFLMRQLPVLKERHPKLHFSITCSPNLTIMEELENGRIDVGFTTQMPCDTNFSSDRIFLDELVLVSKDQSRLTDKITSIKDLSNLAYVDYPERNTFISSWIKHNFNNKHYDTNKLYYSHYVNNLASLTELIVQGHGAAIMPFSCISSLVASRILSIIPGPNLKPLTQEVFWAVRAHQKINKRMSILKEYLSDYTQGINQSLN